MNYTKEQCDEARRRFLDGQPWEKIVEVFATVPQVTTAQWHEAKRNEFPNMREAINAVLAKQEPVIVATPDVTLLDPTGGPSMDVPSSVVHEMERKEDVTLYSHKPIFASDAYVCESCGSVVVDPAKHTAFHERSAKR